MYAYVHIYMYILVFRNCNPICFKHDDCRVSPSQNKLQDDE